MNKELNETRDLYFKRLLSLDKELRVSSTGMIIFNPSYFEYLNDYYWKKLTFLLKKSNIDKSIVEYNRYRKIREKANMMGESTFNLDSQINGITSTLYKKLGNEQILDNLHEWFEIYDNQKYYEESCKEKKLLKSMKDLSRKQVELDDWEIPDEEDEKRR